MHAHGAQRAILFAGSKAEGLRAAVQKMRSLRRSQCGPGDLLERRVLVAALRLGDWDDVHFAGRH